MKRKHVQKVLMTLNTLQKHNQPLFLIKSSVVHLNYIFLEIYRLLTIKSRSSSLLTLLDTHANISSIQRASSLMGQTSIDWSGGWGADGWTDLACLSWSRICIMSDV